MMALLSLSTIPYRINSHFLSNDGMTCSASFHLFLLPSCSLLIPTMEHCMPWNETFYCHGFSSKANVTTWQMLHGWCRGNWPKWWGTVKPLSCVHHAQESSSDLMGLWSPGCVHSADDHLPLQRGAFVSIFVSSSMFMVLAWIFPVVSACVVQVWSGIFTSISFGFASSLAVVRSGGPTSLRETSEDLQSLLEQPASHAAVWY